MTFEKSLLTMDLTWVSWVKCVTVGWLSITWFRTSVWVRIRVTLRLTVSQYDLVWSPLCRRLPRYCFLFKSLGLEFVLLSMGCPLWREAGSVFCKSQSSHLSVCTFTINIFVFHTFIIQTRIYKKQWRARETKEDTDRQTTTRAYLSSNEFP
jgi:hypothetical protein